MTRAFEGRLGAAVSRSRLRGTTAVSFLHLNSRHLAFSLPLSPITPFHHPSTSTDGRAFSLFHPHSFLSSRSFGFILLPNLLAAVHSNYRDIHSYTIIIVRFDHFARGIHRASSANPPAIDTHTPLQNLTPSETGDTGKEYPNCSHPSTYTRSSHSLTYIQYPHPLRSHITHHAQSPPVGRPRRLGRQFVIHRQQ